MVTQNNYKIRTKALSTETSPFHAQKYNLTKFSFPCTLYTTISLTIIADVQTGDVCYVAKATTQHSTTWGLKVITAEVKVKVLYVNVTGYTQQKLSETHKSYK